MNSIIKTLCLLGIVGLITSCSPDPLEETTDTVANFETTNINHDQDFANAILDIINQHRATIELPPLAFNNNAKVVAIEHTAYMAEENHLSHDNFFERSDYLKSQGADQVSENVAYGYLEAQAVFEGWMNSPNHKEAIESDFTATGIGVVRNHNNIPYFTQIFIK